MKKSLIYSLPVLLTAGCSEPANETTPNSIHCVLRPQEEALQPYYHLLAENPQLIDAIGFCERPTSIQEVMWNKIREAEETGLPSDAPLPKSYYDLGLGMKTKSLSGVSFHDFNRYQKIEMVIDDAEYDFYFPAKDKEGRKLAITKPVLGRAVESFLLRNNEKEPIKTIYTTKEEAHEIYAAHLAHSLWLEKNQVVPWSILEYNQEQLEELLQPKAWFKTWDDQKEDYSFHLIVDHSPRENFPIAKEAIGTSSNRQSAMVEIIKSTRPFRHGVEKFDSEGNFVESDPENIVTISVMKEELMSRHGCQTMSPYIIQLANSLNIPGRYINGYYYAAGHRSALFSFTDDVLAHGDDIYHYNSLGNTPSLEVMGSYDFWEENVLIYKTGDTTAAHNSMLHNFKKEMQYPALSLIKSYCNEGREALEERFLYHQFGPFATVEEIDDLEKRILKVSNNCTPPFPENNPDQ